MRERHMMQGERVAGLRQAGLGTWTVALVATFVLQACSDDAGTGPEPVNQNPTAQITATPTEIPLGDGNQTVVSLDGSASTDPDGDPLTYAWSVAGGTFVNGTNAGSQIAQVTFPGNANYPVTLDVSDGRGGSGTAQTTIGVGPAVANQAPIAVIVADPTSVPQGDANQTVVTLDGSDSSDPDGDPLTFSWAVTGATYVNGTSESSEVAQVTFPGNADYAVLLTVSDGRGGTGEAQTVIAVTASAN